MHNTMKCEGRVHVVFDGCCYYMELTMLNSPFYYNTEHKSLAMIINNEILDIEYCPFCGTRITGLRFDGKVQ